MKKSTNIYDALDKLTLCNEGDLIKTASGLDQALKIIYDNIDKIDKESLYILKNGILIYNSLDKKYDLRNGLISGTDYNKLITEDDRVKKLLKDDNKFDYLKQM